MRGLADCARLICRAVGVCCLGWDIGGGIIIFSDRQRAGGGKEQHQAQDRAAAFRSRVLVSN